LGSCGEGQGGEKGEKENNVTDLESQCDRSYPRGFWDGETDERRAAHNIYLKMGGHNITKGRRDWTGLGWTGLNLDWSPTLSLPRVVRVDDLNPWSGCGRERRCFQRTGTGDGHRSPPPRLFWQPHLLTGGHNLTPPTHALEARSLSPPRASAVRNKNTTQTGSCPQPASFRYRWVGT
jgi:hypothetical protein